MTKILLMAAHFHPYKGGLENFALDLGTRLAKRGSQVDVFTFNLGNDKEHEHYNSIDIYRFPCRSILGKTWTLPKMNHEFKSMMNSLLKNDYDAVITNTRFFTTSYLGMKIAKKLKQRNHKTRFIHIEHGNVHVIHINPFVTLSAWLWDETYGRCIFRSADTVIGISGPCASFAKKLGAKKTIVIHNSIDPDFFNGKRKQHKGIHRIITVGRLIYAKGFQDLIMAIKGLPEIELVFIGDGPYRKNLESIAKEAGVRAIFTGTLKREEIRKELLNADLFVNPSYSEGLPTSILEAGAAGTPVIATDVGGTSEILSSSDLGVLMRPKDVPYLRNKIVTLLAQPKLRDKLSENLKKKISKDFNWDTNIKKFESVIKGSQ